MNLPKCNSTAEWNVPDDVWQGPLWSQPVFTLLSRPYSSSSKRSSLSLQDCAGSSIPICSSSAFKLVVAKRIKFRGYLHLLVWFSRHGYSTSVAKSTWTLTNDLKGQDRPSGGTTDTGGIADRDRRDQGQTTNRTDCMGHLGHPIGSLPPR